MEEIEIKILEVPTKKLKEKLKKRGAKRIFSGEIETTFYERKKVPFQKDSYLRLRRKGDKYILGFKRSVKAKHAKIMEEHETEVKNPKETKAILAYLGLTEKKTLKKRRESYQIGKTLFEFDTLPKIPTYLEIEAPSKKELERALKFINPPPEKVKTWGTNKLLKYYKNKP